MSLFSELKRRNVIRVGAAYVVVAWLIIQVAETIFPLFALGDGPARLVVIILAIGFVPALIISWVFELTAQGWMSLTALTEKRDMWTQSWLKTVGSGATVRPPARHWQLFSLSAQGFIPG